MEYTYSTAYDLASAASQGCWSTLPLRIHKDEQLAIDASYEFIADWEAAVAPGKDLDATISLCPNGHFVALTIPECLPERLRIVTRLSDFSYIYDDMTENMSANEADNSVDEFNLAAQSATQLQRTTRKKQLQADMMLELMEIDGDLAEAVLQAWGNYYKTTMTKEQPIFKTVEEFTPYRVMNAGVYVYAEMMAFGMGLKLTPEERKITEPVLTASVTALTIGNDFWSWPKEYREYIKAGGSGEMKSAVYILMKQHNVGPEEALELCKQLTIDWEQKCLKYKAEVEARDPPVSENVLRYIDACVYMASGSLLWHCTAPRYHGKANGATSNGNGVSKNFATVSGTNGDRPVTAHSHRDSAIDMNVSLDDELLQKENGTESSHHERKSAHNGVESTKLKSSSTNGVKKVNGHNDGRGTRRARDEVEETNESKRRKTGSITNGTDIDLYNTVSRGTPTDDIVLAPFEYISSLPSKGVRELAMQALNIWFNVPATSYETIKVIINNLHNASLMLDDIEDGSALRRGKPTTHSIFGVSQTINSANYVIGRAMHDVQSLRNPRSVQIFTDELLNLYCGQSMDLGWAHYLQCPSEAEYIEMVDNKTGGLFRMLAQLMQAESTACSNLILDTFVTLLGRYFQIRDDYQNLMSSDYTAQKGFCEDLDEGKFSLPLIHTLNYYSSSPEGAKTLRMLESIFVARAHTTPQHLTTETKILILDFMKEAGSLDFTKGVIASLQERLDIELKKVEEEGEMGRNSMLRVLLQRLKI